MQEGWEFCGMRWCLVRRVSRGLEYGGMQEGPQVALWRKAACIGLCTKSLGWDGTDSAFSSWSDLSLFKAHLQCLCFLAISWAGAKQLITVEAPFTNTKCLPRAPPGMSFHEVPEVLLHQVRDEKGTVSSWSHGWVKQKPGPESAAAESGLSMCKSSACSVHSSRTLDTKLFSASV